MVVGVWRVVGCVLDRIPRQHVFKEFNSISCPSLAFAEQSSYVPPIAGCICGPLVGQDVDAGGDRSEPPEEN